MRSLGFRSLPSTVQRALSINLSTHRLIHAYGVLVKGLRPWAVRVEDHCHMPNTSGSASGLHTRPMQAANSSMHISVPPIALVCLSGLSSELPPFATSPKPPLPRDCAVSTLYSDQCGSSPFSASDLFHLLAPRWLISFRHSPIVSLSSRRSPLRASSPRSMELSRASRVYSSAMNVSS